jgi:omega-6 fatty acid desaturase (delta-12 desaturase)
VNGVKSAAPLFVATTPADLGINVGSSNGSDDDRKGAMIDLEGIAFSNLKGKALSLRDSDFPKAIDLKAVIPKDCFEPDTLTSLSYLAVSVAGTALCTAVGIAMAGVIGTSSWLTLPIWTAYSAVTGTVAMGLWVLAHECGHGAFSKDKKLQDAVGYILHSLLLVPYYSWQRSHAVHHQFTNHMELGETHVPEGMASEDEGSYAARQFLISALGEQNGVRAWGAIQAFFHLVVGWPAYLLIGATGGPDRGVTNHFYPDPLTEPKQPKRELFPGNWKSKVYQSDVGIAAVLGALVAWAACHGVGEVMALYGGPLLVVNAWLVLYTWLQHTDVDVPHFSQDDHTFVKGALHTIDRPYDKMDPWGAIDFLHHKIGSTHVAHHFDSTIPHYKAQAATDAIKENFPQVYLYEDTPIFQALWRVCKGCCAVEKRGDMWIWKNNGLEQIVQDV